MQLKYLRVDLSRYFYPNDSTTQCSLCTKLRLIITTQGIWAIVVYRFRRWVNVECQFCPLRLLLKPVGCLMQLMVESLTGIHIEPEIDIGPGFYIGHFGNIFLGGHMRIGKITSISHEVTVGYAGRGDKWGLPTIGDFVYIAPGAKIFGRISIGNHVAVGANAVVTKDLPENAVAVGVPARIINYRSSRDFVQFNRERCREILE
ncbi:MAG: serine acetyltransferase [Candidatus Eisenbacteria sp.]|nr:serine acetyltransferase [Candidatus Eisenbacteria bacterium]